MNIKSLITCLVLVITLSSCSTTKESQFYNLSAVESNSKIIENRNIAIGIDTVTVAGYLERPQIVTIKDDTELNMSEFNRWAEPLSDSIQRVVAENISKHMKKGIAKPMNAGRRGYDYTVVVELNKFDGKFNDKAKLDAWWTVYSKDGRILERDHSDLTAPLGADYNDLITKQNQLLNELSLEIIKKISKLR